MADDGRLTTMGWGAIGLFILGAFLGLFVISGAKTGPMMLHGGLITLFCILAVMWIGDRHFDFLKRGPTPRAPDGV